LPAPQGKPPVPELASTTPDSAEASSPSHGLAHMVGKFKKKAPIAETTVAERRLTID
jgi:hypothetical protein